MPAPLIVRVKYDDNSRCIIRPSNERKRVHKVSLRYKLMLKKGQYVLCDTGISIHTGEKHACQISGLCDKDARFAIFPVITKPSSDTPLYITIVNTSDRNTIISGNIAVLTVVKLQNAHVSI